MNKLSLPRPLLATAAFALALAVTGCDPAGNADAPASLSAAEALGVLAVEQPPASSPRDFFPVATGTRWIYVVRVGPAEPLDYYEAEFPYGKGRRMTCTRRLLVPRDFEQAKAKIHRLELCITGEAEQPAAPQYPNGYQIDVVQDDLKLLESAKQLYFATKTRGGFEAVFLATYAPDTDSMNSVPWGSWSSARGADGFGFRMLCFGEKPGTEIGFGKNSRDRLLFVGVEPRHPEIKGGPFLHFRRTVDAAERDDEREPGYLDMAFTEELWFARALGLVRLEQAVDGAQSMVWTLQGSSATMHLKGTKQGVAETLL